MDLAGYTSPGPREANEDNFFASDFTDFGSFSNGVCAFAVVSDGMGGYQGGDIASSIVIAEAEHYLDQLLDMARENQIELDPATALREIVEGAHASVLDAAQQAGGRSMGATFVGVFVSPTHAWIGHVGDSRAYLLRDGNAQQLTEDHSQVGRMLARGMITEEEAQHHPDRNKIEQALGFTIFDTDINETDLQEGDVLLLCSDGVYTVLDSDKIFSCVYDASNAEAAAKRTVDASLSAGTDDNTTALVIMPDRTASGGRHNAPTLAGGVDAVEPKRASRDSERPSARTGKGPQARSSSSKNARSQSAKSGPSRNIILPILIGIALLALLGALAFNACTGPREEISSSAPAAASSDPTAMVAPSSGDAATSAAGTPSSATSVSASSKTYTVQGEDTALRYLNASGEPSNFMDDYEATVYLPVGATVDALGNPDSYGNENYVYQKLSEHYLSDLKDDWRLAQEGTTEFTSSFAQIVGDNDSYAMFLSAIDPNNITALLLVDSVIAGTQDDAFADDTDSTALQADSTVANATADTTGTTGTTEAATGTTTGTTDATGATTSTTTQPAVNGTADSATSVAATVDNTTGQAAGTTGTAQ